MKEIFKNKKVIAGIIIFLVLILIVGAILLVSSNKKENDIKNVKDNTYTMYVKINPLVKLTFKEVEYKCDEPLGYCTKLEGIDYELLNDDARDIYKDIKLKDLEVYSLVGLLCKVARDNGIAFESIKITTDYKFDYDDFKEEMKKNSQYKFDYDIVFDIKELLNEQEIINEDLENDLNVKSYSVTFDSNGGNEVTRQVVKENDKVKKPSSPTKKGYKFVEWQLNGEKYNFDNPVNSDITLVAKWEENNNTTNGQDSKSNNDNNNSNTTSNNGNTTSNNSSSSNTENNTTPATTPAKKKSTPDNINLNDNILIQDPDSVYGLSADVYILPSVEAAIKAKSEILSYLNGQKGVINISINEDPNNFKISYDRIHMSPENVGLDILDFINSFEAKYSNIENEVKNIFYRNGGTIKGNGSGAGSIPDPVLLTESICNKFNLTCSRW